MSNKLFKIWNKQTCFEIYFRPLEDGHTVEVITFLNGDPFVNPRKLEQYSPDGCPEEEAKENIEFWTIEEARENWNSWTTFGGYEVAEVEDYIISKSGNNNKRPERRRRKKQRVKSAMTDYDKLKQKNRKRQAQSG